MSDSIAGPGYSVPLHNPLFRTAPVTMRVPPTGTVPVGTLLVVSRGNYKKFLGAKNFL